MATITLLNPQTGASAGEPSLILPTDSYDNVLVFATGLATTETVGIFVLGGNAEVPYSVAGAAVTLTATQPMQSLPVGPMYRFAKSATTSPSGVFAAVDAS